MNEELFKRKVIKYTINLPQLLKEMGIEVQHNGLMFCPMHDNYNTPAAKLFKDKDGYAFYCFAEGRMYDAYDVYKYALNASTNILFHNIWTNLPDDVRQNITDLFGEYSVEVKVDDLEFYQEFKENKITYQELLTKLSS